MLYKALQKIASFIYPIKIKSYYSEYSGTLELVYYNGRLHLDTKNTNYSYGNLQKILAQSMSSLPVTDWVNFKNILVLGVAGGSVIETLCTKFKFSGRIDAVDIDPVVLEIAKKDFNIKRFKNCNLILADANHFVVSCSSTYDLLIVDLFLDDFMPDFVLQAAFIENLKKRVRTNGVVILNTIKAENESTADANNIRKLFASDFRVQILNHLNPFNTVFLLRKIKKA